MSNSSFYEVQRFRTRWAWMAVIAINAFFLYAIIQQVVLGKQFGTKPASDTVLLLLEVIPLLLLFFVISIRLKTEYTVDGISYRYFPFQFKTTFIAWHELQDAYLREYSSFYEYGGWGIRKGTAKAGNAINTSQSGPIGLQLIFHDGKKLLIGTRKPNEIKIILDTITAEGKINRQV